MNHTIQDNTIDLVIISHGASLNQAWIDIGARITIGPVMNNYMAELVTTYLLADWSTGNTAGISKSQARNFILCCILWDVYTGSYNLDSITMD